MNPIAPSLADLRNVQAGDHEHAALHGIDLQAPAGPVLALPGRIGIAKSNAVSVLSGLCRANASDLEAPGGGTLQRRRRVGMGVMLQGSSLPTRVFLLTARRFRRLHRMG